MSRYRIKVPGGANYIPKALFSGKWEVQLYIRLVLGDLVINGIKIEKA